MNDTHDARQAGPVQRVVGPVEMRNLIGSVPIYDEPGADNLAIALCCYFERHPRRPRPDLITDNGWGAWVEQQANAALERIAAAMTPNAD